MKILNLGTVTLIAVATTLLIGCNKISGIDEIEFASSDTDTNISSSTDSQSDSNIPKNTDNGSDSGSDSDTNIEVGSDTHSDIDTTTNTDTNPGSNTDTDTNTDTGADTDTGTENDSDSDSYADCSALADGACEPCYECMTDVDGGSCFDDAMICWGDADCAPFNDCRNECGKQNNWWGDEFDTCVEACPGSATWAPVIDAMHTCVKAVCTEC